MNNKKNEKLKEENVKRAKKIFDKAKDSLDEVKKIMEVAKGSVLTKDDAFKKLNKISDISKSKSMYFSRSGEKIGLGDWAKYLEDGNYKVLMQEDIKIKSVNYFVSTVWLGLDHGFNDRSEKDYRPIIFETMVFIKRSDFMKWFAILTLEIRRGFCNLLNKIKLRSRGLLYNQIDFNKDIYQDRYCTELEAMAGHRNVIELLKKGKIKSL